MATAAGCMTNFKNEIQAATCRRSADLKAKDAPIANNAPGVAADPSIDRNSSNGATMGIPRPDQINPAEIDMIIGFFSNPKTSAQSVANRTWPSREPTINITIKDPNNIKSTARTMTTKPIASGPISKASIGTPKNPTLPITAQCASIAASSRGTLRPKATSKANP